MKRILFPFFKERHDFLLHKWWFRLIIVIYAILFVVAPFIILSNYMDSSVGWCYQSLPYIKDYVQFNKERAVCDQFSQDAQAAGRILATVGPLIIHYLIQLIFFKVVVDFIVLGGKTRYKNSVRLADLEKNPK